MESAIAIAVPVGLFELAMIALMVVIYQTMAAEERAVKAREWAEGARSQTHDSPASTPLGRTAVPGRASAPALSPASPLAHARGGGPSPTIQR